MQKTASKHSNTIQARASAMMITELFGHVTFGNTFPGVQTPRGRGSAYFSWDYSRRKRNWKQCLCTILGGVLPIHLSCILSEGLFYLFSTHSPNKTRKYLIIVLETFVKQLLLLASHKDVLYRDPLGTIVWRAKRMSAWEATFTSCLAKVSSCSREQGREGRKVR